MFLLPKTPALRRDVSGDKLPPSLIALLEMGPIATLSPPGRPQECNNLLPEGAFPFTENRRCSAPSFFPKLSLALHDRMDKILQTRTMRSSAGLTAEESLDNQTCFDLARQIVLPITTCTMKVSRSVKCNSRSQKACPRSRKESASGRNVPHPRTVG